METAEKLFKTHGEASKYCNDNGFDVPGNANPWEIADKIIKIRADQDKITRHAGAENILMLDQKTSLELKGSYIDVDKAHAAIMNVKAI